ncbi:uncharacterized protein HD556DRAFT_318472 [Suillus plorans]|uniref:Uncharacterized protein n=1 Tax=Suillus plorans TaxID=116603 RepID=A0A9P7DYM2_9AGAM|nr:uncharacterized protein HD556DRAFT_318472 [Suillus plorans]KAG1806520.1 hypothetical protein HD556DRAFT_318472 [Suillus plorans]
MAYDDEHADILGGPILQIPDTGILGQWSQYSILFRASLILALGLLVSLISVRAWDIWKKNQELGYRKAMRRKHGIPDSDCRPFAVAYAAATRARAEREAQDRIQANNVTEEPPAINNQVPLVDAHGLRRRAADSVTKPHVNQLPATRRTISGFDHKPNGFDFAHRYNPRLRDGLLPLARESLTPLKRSYRRASRKDLVFDPNVAVEGKKRAYDHEGNHELAISKKSRVDSDDLIDDDEELELLEEEDELEPAQRGSKRTFDSDEEVDYMRTDGRDKRPRNMSRAQTPEDQEMEAVEDDVAELHPIPRGKKRDRAEAGSTFGGDDEEGVLDDQDDRSHRHRKRRTVRPRKPDGSSRGRKRDRDSESPASEGSTGGSHRHSERTSKKKKGAKKTSSVTASDALDGSQDPLCKGRKIGEVWESSGVQYKVGNEGERLRLTLVKKARSKYSMPRDSQHPDRQANMEIYVETWLTDEQYKDSEERQELVWQETPRASIEPSTPGEAPLSPTKTGKDLLWDSMKNSPVSSRASRQSLTNGPIRVNPFKQPLPQATTGRRVASSNVHTPPLIPGVAEGPSRPGFRAFSKWEKQDLEAEAMARMRARMLEQKKGEIPQSKAFELPTSATAPELGPKAPAVPIITFTPPPPTASTSGSTETKSTPSLFSFGNTSTSTDASKPTAPTTSSTPASVTPAASVPVANKPSQFPTSSTPQITPAVPPSSFGPPTTQPTSTTTTVPITSSTPSIPDFFAKPAAPSTPAPAATPVPTFSFGPTPAQPLFVAPASVSTNTFFAPAASGTETGKPAPFPFAKPSVLPPSVPASTSAQANPTSIFGAPSSNAAPASAPLKFDFGKKPASTIPKPAAASPPTVTATDAAKQTSPLFAFSAAAPQSSPLGASPQQKFSFGQPSSASVFGSGSNATATSKPAETSEAPKPKGAETETPKFSFSPLSGGSAFSFTGASLAPKSTPSFGAPSGASAFAITPSSGGDAKKTDASLSIFGAANAAKEDGSKAGASTPAVFGGSSFGTNANGISSNIFEKSSVPQPSGDVSTSTFAPKSVFGNATSSNAFSTTPAGSPAVSGSAQPGTFTFGNGSDKHTDSVKPSPFAPSSNPTSAVFSFGKKEDTAAPSSSSINTSTAPASSTPTFAFGSSVFGQPSTSISNGPTQQQSVFGKPSAPTPSAFGFSSGAGTGTGNSTFAFGGQPGGQNQQQ